jgi:hypothetical protein
LGDFPGVGGQIPASFDISPFETWDSGACPALLMHAKDINVES